MGDALENIANTCENIEAPANEGVPVEVTAAREAPAGEAGADPEKTLWDSNIKRPATGTEPPDEALRTQMSHNENHGSFAGQKDDAVDNDQKPHDGKVATPHKMTKGMNLFVEGAGYEGWPEEPHQPRHCSYNQAGPCPRHNIHTYHEAVATRQEAAPAC